MLLVGDGPIDGEGDVWDRSRRTESRISVDNVDGGAHRGEDYRDGGGGIYAGRDKSSGRDRERTSHAGREDGGLARRGRGIDQGDDCVGSDRVCYGTAR